MPNFVRVKATGTGYHLTIPRHKAADRETYRVLPDHEPLDRNGRPARAKTKPKTFRIKPEPAPDVLVSAEAADLPAEESQPAQEA